jgi:uncharacterized membrane protein
MARRLTIMQRDAVREYMRGSLWVLPTACVLGALILGTSLSLVNVGPDSPLAFQGTSDDARSLLIGITGTMVTVIALLLGLAVVALQLSSTQFSPRVLRNFLRDRPNQVVLGVFVGTFAYSAAGLFTVGVSGGERSAEFPRFAVSVAIALLFLSLTLLVFFADHLAHSIQVDSVMRVIQRNTLPVIRAGLFASEQEPPAVPPWATPVAARHSGYVQVVDLRRLLAAAADQHLIVRLRPRVGEHVVAGTVLAWAWHDPPGESPPRIGPVDAALERTVRIGFERTLEQDPGFGFRQLVDIACKALSPAVNDPYTAIQAIDHLSVLFGALAVRPVGVHIARDAGGKATIIVPSRRFSEHLAIGVGLIRRYGAGEPTVVQALLRLLSTCAGLTIDQQARWSAIERETELLLADAERAVPQRDDLGVVHAEAENVRRTVAARRAERSGVGEPAPVPPTTAPPA